VHLFYYHCLPNKFVPSVQLGFLNICKTICTDWCCKYHFSYPTDIAAYIKCFSIIGKFLYSTLLNKHYTKVYCVENKKKVRKKKHSKIILKILINGIQMVFTLTFKYYYTIKSLYSCLNGHKTNVV